MLDHTVKHKWLVITGVVIGIILVITLYISSFLVGMQAGYAGSLNWQWWMRENVWAVEIVNDALGNAGFKMYFNYVCGPISEVWLNLVR